MTGVANITAPRAPAAVIDVLTTPKMDLNLNTVLRFLKASQIANSCCVNRKFNANVRHSRSLESAIFDFQIKEYRFKKQIAPRSYFSAPTHAVLDFEHLILGMPGNQAQHFPILNLKHLYELATILEKQGNRELGGRVKKLGLDLDTVLVRGKEVSFAKLRPTEIIRMIPKQEVGDIYKYLWQIIGRPNKAHAGEDAFHGKNGMNATSLQKAKAIRLFLRDKVNVGIKYEQ